MRKTLYIHIGHFKSGSTALQTAFARNRLALALSGLDYPDVYLINAKHSHLAFAIYKAAGVQTLMHGYARPDAPEAMWGRLFDHVRASDCPKVLISSEEFMRMGAYPEAARRLRDLVADTRDIDIRILAYLRAPGAHLASWYSQLVKMRQKVPDYVTALSETIESVHLDYGKALAPWIEIFGADAVILRPYDKAMQPGNGLLADFLKVLDLPLAPDDLDLPLNDPNPSLHPKTRRMSELMLARGMPAPMVRAMSERAETHFHEEDLLEDVSGDALAEVAARCRAGLDAIRDLPHNGIDCDAYARKLPSVDDLPRVDPADLVPFLVGELYLLRRDLNRTIARIAALENKADGDEGS